jgi:GPH family glycoside/pentoside/hexuronide:cation symporter
MAPFDGLTQPVALLIYMVVISWLWEGVSTAVSTGYYSLLPEMFTTYSSRTAVAVSMNIVQTIGLLVAFALPPFLYGSEALGEYGWYVLGISFGIVALIVIYVGLRGMFERPGYAGETTLPIGEALKATFNNRSFVTVVLAQTFRFVGTNALAAATPLFIKYTLQVDESGTAAILATAFITAAAVLWFWKKFIAERLEPRSTLMLANAVMVLAVIPTAFAQTLTVAVIGAAGLGIGLAGLILMGDVIVADVIDEDEVNTGHRREGMYFGMSKFIMTLSNAIVGLVFLAITALYGYDETITEVAQQAPTVAMGFRVFMAAPVIGGSILGIISLLFYPLHGERLKAVKETLAARHAGEADESITVGG